MLNKINFFQLDNLINNRVPFMFYNMSAHSVRDWYQSVSRNHVETYEKLLPEDKILVDIDLNKLPKDYAIVLLCQNGEASLQFSKNLTQLAYTNVYVVDGGYQQMVTERQQI